MPKPKRQSKNEQKMELDEASSTTSLTNEVKRIKLTRETPPPVNKSTKKRPNDVNYNPKSNVQNFINGFICRNRME